MKIVTLNGSPRKNGNSSLLLSSFIKGSDQAGAETEQFFVHSMNIKPCRGCLRCNIFKRCVIKGDDWGYLAEKILDSDVLVFAGPVYFHHLSGPLKTVLDRFRSFINVKITPDGLIHTPWVKWEKHFVLLSVMGSSNQADAQPIIDLFQFITKELGEDNRFSSLLGTRLARAEQLCLDEEQLTGFYKMIGFSEEFAKEDVLKNKNLLDAAYLLGSGVVFERENSSGRSI